MDLPNLDAVISKVDVEKVILHWCENNISNEDLFEWVNENYFPAVQEIAPNEDDHTQLALSLMLNEFECTRPEAYRREGARTAIDFVNTTLPEFRDRLERFLKECFTNSPCLTEIDLVMERHRSILSDH